MPVSINIVLLHESSISFLFSRLKKKFWLTERPSMETCTIEIGRSYMQLDLLISFPLYPLISIPEIVKINNEEVVI